VLSVFDVILMNMHYNPLQTKRKTALFKDPVRTAL